MFSNLTVSYFKVTALENEVRRCKSQAKVNSEKAQSDLEALEKMLNVTRMSSEAIKRRLETEEKNLTHALSQKVGTVLDFYNKKTY